MVVVIEEWGVIIVLILVIFFGSVNETEDIQTSSWTWD